MKHMLEVMSAITSIPAGEERKLSAIVRQQEIKKGEIFLQAGAIPQKLAFVSSGLFRYFYMSQKGVEFTKGFFPEGSFIVSYSAMVKQTPSYYSIEALEDSIIHVLDYQKWSDLVRGHACWTLVLIAVLQKGYMKKESREREFLLLNAEERYQSFIQEYPDLESRIKQHLIASYLGITPVALSRIRGKLK